VPTLPEGGIFSGAFWTGAFGGFVIYASIQWWANVNSDGGGKVIQRMSAAKNEAHAFGATLWFNVAHYALRTWPWVIAALASLVLLPNLADDELAYPQLIALVLPSPWKGVLLAGLLAAFMSTIDTQLNWGASYLTHDVYRRWLSPGREDRHYVRIAKLATLLLIVLTALMAYRVKSVTEAFKFLIAFGAGTGPVYLLRWFWWRVSAWSEIGAMAASTVISSTLYLAWPGISFPLKVVLTAGGSALLWLPLTFALPPPTMETLVAFWRRTRPPGAWAPVRRAAGGGAAYAPNSLRADLAGWAGGVALTLGATFALGLFLFGENAKAAAAALVMVAGGLLTARWMRATFRPPENGKPAGTASARSE
ncbi:MAG TPA: sodium:proline symporter, partial [Bacteroidetes bacterium]|nr:sodium:proline symporter [Bacteroidota bacterium]